MKIRCGFVSNSSASSFCLYGWKDSDFIIDSPVIRSIFVGQMEGNLIDFVTFFNKKYSIHLSYVYDRSGSFIVGLDETRSEIDHYNDEWESYQCDPPTEKEIEKMDEISKELSIPKPTLYSDTFYDG